MSIVMNLRDEVADMKLKSHYEETQPDSNYFRIIEILDRQAKIIEILGKINPEYLKRFADEG